VLDLLVSDQYADLNDTDTAGSSLAYQLSRQAPDKSICVLEAKDVASGASKVSRLPLLVNLMLQVVAMVGISPLMHPQLSPTSPHHSRKAELAYMPKQP
jgi:glycine/D-amino acid oxidase-like deaminating enzyme